MQKEVVLASASPRRKELLDLMGIKYETIPAELDECFLPDELPRTGAERIARKKAETVGKELAGGLVLAADTIVVCDDEVLGKPRDEDDAFRILYSLSDKFHEVITAVCLYDVKRAESKVESEVTLVLFRRLSTAEILDYIHSGEAMDKAGAYGIQGSGSKFVKCIDGCFFNVVGLPINRVCKMLACYGIKSEVTSVTQQLPIQLSSNYYLNHLREMGEGN